MLEAAFSIAIGLGVAWVSQIFSVPEVVKRANARFYAPLLYAPGFFAGYQTTGRRHVTVVTIDDDDLRHAGLESWPPPLEFYASLIDNLAARKPRAIFLDMLFLDDRPDRSVDALRNAACRALERGHIRVYIASLAGQGKRPASATESLLLAAPPGGTPCISRVAPNATDDAFDHVAWDYPLQSDGQKSAALAMACDSGLSACPPDTVEPMALVWGLEPAPGNAEIFIAGAPPVPVCWSERPFSSWFLWRGGGFHLPRSFPEWSTPRCPYNRVVPVRAFDGVGLSNGELGAALHDKLVLVGSSFQGAGDTVVSPLHGRLPGVHLHAMALDNLLTYAGDGGYRRSGDFHPCQWTAATQFTLLAVVLLTVGMASWSYLSDSWRERARISPAIAAARARRRRVPRRSASARWSAAVGWTLLYVVSLGHFPRRPAPLTRAFRWGRPVLAVVLTLVGIDLLFVIGDRWTHVGPLSMIEYLLFPLGVEFLHGGERAARILVAGWYGLQRRDAAAYFRQLTHHAAEHGEGVQSRESGGHGSEP